MVEGLVTIACDQCGREYRVKDVDPEKSYSCAHCHHLIAVKPVSCLLAETGESPYREVIQHFIDEKSSSRLRDEAVDEESLLPYHLKETVAAYLQSLSLRLAEDRGYWRTATCREALETIVEVAMEVLPIETMIATKEDAFREENQALVFRLFKIANLSFAHSASVLPKQRKLMGIHNHLFH